MSIEDNAEPGDSAGTPPGQTHQGKVRWRRFGAMMALSAAAAGTLVVLTAQGALAANFSISGMPFTVTATELDGNGFEQFATLDNMPAHSPNAGNTGGQMVLIVSVIGYGELHSLCQSINLGGEYIRLTAGTDPANPVKATNLVVDSSDIQGDANFTNINIGQDASTLDATKNYGSATGGPGTAVTGPLGILGQQAQKVQIKNLRQVNYATTAAQFTLPSLHMSFSGQDCP